MGLAILERDNSTDASVRFRMRLGTNRFWSYAIGEKKGVNHQGLPVLKTHNHVSRIFGPLPDRAFGRGMLEVPSRLFDRKNRYVQLTSYREVDRVGPAISEIVDVSAIAAPSAELPTIAFAREVIGLPEYEHVENIPFDVREAQMSKGMFLGAIAGLLPAVLPAVTKLLPTVAKMLPAIGNIFGGLLGGKGSKGGKGAGLDSILGELGKPENMKMITGLLGQLAAAKAITPRCSDEEEKALAYTAATTVSPRHNEVLAEAAAIPAALIAALPALMPLLEKVLNPETIKTIMGEMSPTKTISAVTDSVEKLGKLGLEQHKAVMGHIEKVHPKLASEDKIVDMVANMSIARNIEPNYQRIESVTLNFPVFTTINMYGRERIVYRYGRSLGFPLSVEAPGAIREAILQITIKDAETLEVITFKKFGIKELRPGSFPKAPTIPWSQLDGLRRGEDYLVSACLTWQSRKSGRRIGTCRQMMITAVDEYAFDHVEQGSELIPLNDPARYREYWHQVWKGTFTKTFKGVDFQCRYYYKFDRERTSNARMETVTKETDRNLKNRTAMLKSGMRLSVDGLLKLRAKLLEASNEVDALIDEGVLAALRTSDFEERFDQIGTTAVRFRGRAGENVSLWAYPVIKQQHVKLKKVDSEDEFGNVTSMTDYAIDFPMPVMMHMVGLKSE